MIVKELDFLRRVDKFISKSAFLFYGPNIGKAEEISKYFLNYIQRNDSGFDSVIKCNDEIISLNENFIANNMSSDDLFGNKKIIICNLSNTKNFTNHIKNLSVNNFKHTKLLVKCGELEKKNLTRKIFDEDTNFVSVACYEDTFEKKKEIILSYIKNNNEQIDETFLNIIANTSGQDRRLIYQNLEKIISYLKSGNKLTTKKLMNIINEINKYEIDQLIYSVFSGKTSKIEKIYNLLIKQGINNITIINALVRHLYRILEIKENYSQLHNLNLALKKIYPPIFYKLEKEFLLHSKIWRIKSIESFLIDFFDIEKKIKSNIKSLDTIIKFKLIQISILAEKRKKLL